MTAAVNIAQSGLNNVSFRNRIINGAMVINQRATSITANATDNFYTVDRWRVRGETADGVFTAAQSSTAPTGFQNSLLITVTTADASIGATQIYAIEQLIEGYNVADLGWGASGAAAVTLSFWIRSSLTGTFGGSLRNDAGNRSYPFTYTISAANTWEQKTVTVAGDTTGTWEKTTSAGMWVNWSLGVGSSRQGTAGAWNSNNNFGATGETAVISTNGATFYITGVQLEKGSTATSFDYRPYGTELILAQRYAFKRLADGSVNNFAPFGMGRYFGTTSVQLYVPFPVTMRTSPSSITVGGTLFVNDAGFGGATFTSPVLNESSCDGATITGGTTSSGTAGYATTFYANDTSVASILFFAEL
jgi:hypothetical protein